MAVLIEGNSVVARVDAMLTKVPGGWETFQRICPNQTLCADGQLARVGFMTPADTESFIRELQGLGLEFLRSDDAIDIAVVDQIRGPTSRCSWLEFGHIDVGGNRQRVAACRLAGSQSKELVTPTYWKFEGSLSSTFAFVPTEHLSKAVTYLRHENGLDVYLNPLTGREAYVGRTRK